MNKKKIINIIVICTVVLGFGVGIEQYSKLNNKNHELIIQNKELQAELDTLHEEFELYKLLETVDNDTVRDFISNNITSLCEAEDTIEYAKELESKNEEITAEKLENNIRMIRFTLDTAPNAKKPVIYVYNTTGKTEIHLTLNNTETSTMEVEYPKHDELVNNTYIWNVQSSMDGKLKTEDNEEYNYIFWEASIDKLNQQEFKDGFCIKGENTEKFLKESLKELNLTPTEYNDFIVYWLPQMQNNNYNIIRFCGIDETDTDDTYLKETQLAVYNNDQIIENQLRIMMIWYSSDEPIEIKEQNLKDFAIVRDNITPTVIEWGGTQINR